MDKHVEARVEPTEPGLRPRRVALFAVMAMLVALIVPALAAPAAHAGVATCGGLTVTVDIGQGQMPTPEDDVIVGTDGDDLIAAMSGDDTICGLGGNDTIWGQAGDDTILGDEGDDKLRGGAGQDFLDGAEGADDLAGGSGDDLVLGGPGDDVKVRGGTGDDIVDGLGGDDALVAGNGGEDAVFGGAGNDKVTGGPRPDFVIGETGDDELKGNKGADFLDGGPGADTLLGGPQPDNLSGGPGIDDCNGGTTGGDALENDNAIDCETETNIEGADVTLPMDIGPSPVIGTAAIGGPLANAVPTEILAVEILESDPEQLKLTFEGPPVGCFAAEAIAFSVDEVVLVSLVVGSPVDGPDACAAVIETHMITIQLTESLDGREVVLAPLPGGFETPLTFDTGTLGPELDESNLIGVPVGSVEVILGSPDQLVVTFAAGPAECWAAEAGAFGYDDRIEVFAVTSFRIDLPPMAVCTANLVNHVVTIELTDPIGDRVIVTPPPLVFDVPPAAVPVPGNSGLVLDYVRYARSQATVWGR